MKQISLHESLLLHPVIILIILFCIFRTLTLYGVSPEYYSVVHKRVKIGTVNNNLQYSICIFHESLLSTYIPRNLVSYALEIHFLSQLISVHVKLNPE